MRRLFSRLVARARHRRFQRELDEELDFHRSMKERDLEASLPLEEARYAARRAMGNETLAMEEARAVWIAPALETIWQDLRYGARTMRREPAFALAVIFTLTLGIGATTAIFSVVNAALLKPPPYPGAAGILVLTYPGGGVQDGQIFHYVRERARSFEHVAARGGGAGWNLVVGGRAEYLAGLPVSEGFFAVLGVRPLIGREFSTAECLPGGPPAVVLSEAVWRRLLHGRPDALGEVVLLGGIPHTVVGVMPAGFQTVPAADLWTPLRVLAQDNSWNYYVLGRLRPGVPPAQAAKELDLLRPAIHQDLRGISENRSRELMWISLREQLGMASRETLMLLFGAVGFLLLIACVNVASLQLARALARGREMATRVALGGGSSRLVRQVLTESLFLAMAGSVAALLIAHWGAGAMTAIVPPALLAGHPPTLDIRVLLVTLAVAVGAGIFFGLAPALSVVRLDVRSALQEGQRNTAGRRTMWLRRAFNVMQVALAVVLLAGSGLLIRTFVNLRGAELGFDPENVIVGSMSLQGSPRHAGSHIVSFFEQTLARIEELPDVAAAAVASNVPVERGLNMALEPPADALVREMRAVDWRHVTSRYFDVFGIALRSGRIFDRRDGAGSPPVVIVNEAFSRVYFGEASIEGRYLQLAGGLGDPPREIVGVVSDVRALSGSGWTAGRNALGSPAAPTIYVPVGQVPEGLLEVAHHYFPVGWAVRTRGSAQGATRSIEEVVRAAEPTLPFIGFRTMNEVIARDLETQRFMMVLLALFAAVALALAGVGMYGLVSYGVTRRTQEVAVRMALGASNRRILGAFVGEGLIVGAAGVVCGLAGAAATTRLLSSVIHDVQPLDPLTFAVVALVLVLIVGLASLVPAARAARISPSIALRMD
jgi:putative ABC transport system permease protein